MLGVSEVTMTWGWRVDVKVRRAPSLRRTTPFLADRRAEPSARVLGILIAMIEDSDSMVLSQL